MRPCLPALGVLAALALAPAVVLPAETQEIRISADKMEADYGTRRVAFSGHVEVKGKDIRIQCDRLEAAYGETGDLLSLRSEGNVRLEYLALNATAGRAEVDLPHRRIVLTGSPSATQNGARLEGESIEINLIDGKMEVKGAHGVFRVTGSRSDG